MSRKGHCHGSALAEALFAEPGTDCFGNYLPANHQKARILIFDWKVLTASSKKDQGVKTVRYWRYYSDINSELRPQHIFKIELNRCGC